MTFQRVVRQLVLWIPIFILLNLPGKSTTTSVKEHELLELSHATVSEMILNGFKKNSLLLLFS